MTTAQQTSIKKILLHLTDDELLKLVEELKLPTIPEDALVRKIILEWQGEINILVLQMNQLLWPLLEEVSTRLEISRLS
jgi:hypothetical protein